MRQGFDSKPKQKCPQCGKIAPRLLSTPAVVFKGSGFYKTEARGADTGDAAPSTPAVPDVGAAGHGHSHGPGGHSHDTPAPAAKESTSADSSSGAKSSKKSDASPAKSSGSGTEGAAAG